MMTTKCCKCDKVKLENRWIERDAFPEERFSYTYCTGCLRDFRREMWRERLAVRVICGARAHAV
ncbi:MAG: hypothetical protein IID09_09395 [Candidatus Hydrogenedentes bacterium]|nr:hypothetical protein [Candidatus Hydrogenedentota bacterium]